MANRVASAAARGAKKNQPLRALARLGFAVNGLLHVLIVVGILARGSDAKGTWARRLGEWGKAVAYLAIAGTAFTFANGGSTNAAQSTSGFADTLVVTPGGIIVLFAIGVGVVGIGIYFVIKGAKRKFTDDITVPSTTGGVVIVLGVVGYIAKGIAPVVTGGLFVVAGFTIDPSKATGLDGALKSLVALPYGPAILFLVGAGLIAYGLYCFARARLARM